MTELDKIILVSGIARMLEKMSEDRIAAMWAEMLADGADADERQIFKAAAHAVRARRLVMAPAANLLAA